MKKLLNNGRVIVSFVSVFAILAVSLLSMFAGGAIFVSADSEANSEETAVTYPLNGTYDASFNKIDGSGISYTDVKDTYIDSQGVERAKTVSNFTGFENNFIVNAQGNGTASNPYIIETANQFASVATGRLVDANGNPFDTESVCFKISDSVKAFNLSNTDSTVDFSQNMTAAEVETALKDANVNPDLRWKLADDDKNIKAFKGHLDGNGAVVYGLKSNEDDAGLFPKICGNVLIKNLTVKNSYFYGNRASAFMPYNRKLNNYTSSVSQPQMISCSAYNNVIISKNGGDSITKAGIFIGETVGYEAFMTITDCLVYENIAKHETRQITYGLVGNLHNNTSATITNSIIMDAVPYTLYYGSNAFFKSTYTNVYTNTLTGEERVNQDGNSKYVYKYVPNADGTVSARFDCYNATTGNNIVNGGNGFERKIQGPMINLDIDKSEIDSSNSLKGIDPERWTYNADSYPTPKVYHVREYSSGTVWSGEQACMFVEGDGSQSSPYVINTAEEFVLMLISDSEGKYYKLGTDIIINDTSAENWTQNAKKWFTSNDIPTFKGNLDGNSHNVSGIYYDGSQVGECVGLIPVIASPGSVKNIKVINSDITANNGNAGAVVGFVADRCKKVIKFDAISVDDTVEISGRALKGGIVGKVGYSVIRMNDCISESNGIFAEIGGEAKVNRCVSVNSYPFGNTTNVSAKNVYTNVDGDRLAYTGDDGNEVDGITVLNTDEMKGSAAATNMSGLNFPISWSSVTDDFPAPTGNAASSQGVVGEVWSGAIASSFQGSGTEEDPWIIDTAEKLARCIVYNTSGKYTAATDTEPEKFEYKYYKLTADIYLNDINSKLWGEKIGCNEWYDAVSLNLAYGKFNNFQYTVLDGNGYVVYGMYIDDPAVEYMRGGLIPQAGAGTVVKNIGISESYLVADSTNDQNALGAIYGVVRAWYREDGRSWTLDHHDGPANTTVIEQEDFIKHEPRISNCFVDHTCYAETYNTGGFIGAAWGPVIMENCIFTGTLKTITDILHGGTFMGDDSSLGSTIRNCVSLPLCCTRLWGGTDAATWRTGSYVMAHCENVYYFSTRVQTGAASMLTKISNPDSRLGSAAKAAMPGLDWEETLGDGGKWRVIDGGTPVLTKFAETRSNQELEKFSSKTFNAPFVTVSFMTDTTDVTVDDIEGRMYSKMTLPIISRPGYIFTGWYVFDDLSIEYPYDYFPPRDLMLFAGWEENGVIQNFEDYTDTDWDRDETKWRLNKPGAKGGYKSAYVRNGSRSMHLLDTNTEPADVLLNYEDMLEPGQAYTMTFWVTTDKVNNPATLLTLVHNEKPVYLDTQVAAENMAVVTGLKVGEWVQYSYSFTAQTKWVSIRATGNSSLYFDDIVIGKIDGKLNGGNLIGPGTGSAGLLSPNTGDAISVAVLISALMACAVVVVISRKNTVEVID